MKRILAYPSRFRARRLAIRRLREMAEQDQQREAERARNVAAWNRAAREMYAEMAVEAGQ